MSADLQEGALFAGRYRVLRRIAAGGMGAVYEVLHLETDRRRALKVMLPHVLQNDDLRERFKREAKVAARIDSEFIVEVFDAGIDDATRMPFLVMELLKGEELGQRLKRLGQLPPVEVVEYLRQTALALDKTHKASIVHRDLKPENLFLTEREDGPPRVKVLDFGIAKLVAESATAGGATQSIGTPLYMAPEQFNPHAQLSGAADLYAMGMVAYTLLVGSAYWSEETRGGNLFALAAVAVHGPREAASARAIRKGVTLPAGFDAWFARMTAAYPGHRFATASDAVRALSEALGVTGPAREPMVSRPVAVAAPTVDPTTIPLPSTTPTSLHAQVTSPGMTTTSPGLHEKPANRSRALLAAAGVLGLAAVAGVVAIVALRQPATDSRVPSAPSAPTSTQTSAAATIAAAPAESATAAPSASETPPSASVLPTVTPSAPPPPVAPSGKAPGPPRRTRPSRD